MIRRKSIYLFAMLSTLLVFSTTITSSLAADYTKVGVAVGTTADYSYSSSLNWANISSVHISVTKVSGTVVNITETFFLKNGSSWSQDIAGNISEDSNDVGTFLICSGLGAGDNTTYDGNVKINGTVPIDAAGASRSANNANGHGSSFIFSWSYNYYFDQLTGLMIKSNQYNNFFGWTNYTLTATSLWPAIDPVILIVVGVAVVAVIALVAVIVVVRRRGKHR